MHHINHIDFFSINANVCAQKSLKRICTGFDPVTPLIILNSLKEFIEIET